MMFVRRPDPVAARLRVGFWVTEAVALQKSIENALHVREAARTSVPAELTFERGRGDRVVASWRNLIVGFVPESHRADLVDQLERAGRAPLTAPAVVHRLAEGWRIWAGPPWPEEEPAPEYPAGEIPPAERRVFGIPLRHSTTPD